jgi:hypothetical protein
MIERSLDYFKYLLLRDVGFAADLENQVSLG